VVVLDDRLVNADEQRLGRLGGILGEAASRCQILLATCRSGAYAVDGAHEVCVPEAGRSGAVEG